MEQRRKWRDAVGQQLVDKAFVEIEAFWIRLADAIRELQGLEGLQTHRSWWVARQGLADVVKGDGRLVLKLKSGAEAPVSRTYIKDVRAAGWI